MSTIDPAALIRAIGQHLIEHADEIATAAGALAGGGVDAGRAETSEEERVPPLPSTTLNPEQVKLKQFNDLRNALATKFRVSPVTTAEGVQMVVRTPSSQDLRALEGELTVDEGGAEVWFTSQTGTYRLRYIQGAVVLTFENQFVGTVVGIVEHE